MIELRGKPVADFLEENNKIQIDELIHQGIIPKLAIIRIGQNSSDIAYEKSVIKKFLAMNALVEVNEFPESITQENLENIVISLNKDKSVHGILLFRPLPKHLREDSIKAIIDEHKDVDCMGFMNMAKVFASAGNGFTPCTAQAVIELLDYYHIQLSGKKVVVVGRSLVIGKPISMLLLCRNSTVTICHTKTINLADECKQADIIIACAGSAKMIKKEFTNENQVIIDVGINVMDGKLCGDVDYENIAGNVYAITPVPGGVGAVTTSVLLKHTVKSASSKK